MTTLQTYVAKCEDCGHKMSKYFGLLNTNNLSSPTGTVSGARYSSGCSKCNSENITILDVGQKHCTKCDKKKPKLDFSNPNTFSGYSRYCIDCTGQFP